MKSNSFLIFLRQIHIALNDAKRNRHIVRVLSEYLCNGDYQDTLSFDYIYNKRYSAHLIGSTFASNIEDLQKISRFFIKILNTIATHHVKKCSVQKLFEGTELIISSSRAEYKVFDFKKMQVLSLYDSGEKLQRVIDSKNALSNAYNVPKSFVVNKDRKYIIEELISHEKYDLESAFLLLCDCFCKYLKSDALQLSVDKQAYNLVRDYYESRMGTCQLIHDDVGSIMCFIHGDLWSSNIIYNKGKVYVLDFEHSGTRYFLYDFFMFMFTEWHLKNDDRLVVNYFKGYYDNILSQIFKNADCVYNKSHRSKYFMVFIATILYERWQNYDAMEEKIREFINMYI